MMTTNEVEISDAVITKPEEKKEEKPSDDDDSDNFDIFWN